MTFVLPAWAATRMKKGRLRASDPAYLKLRHSWIGGQDLGEELLVSVHASATLTGRVVDENGKPVKAEVFATVPPDSPFAGMRPSTNARANGAWSMQVPASLQLKVVARPTRDDSLLPAAVVVKADAGAEVDVGDLFLARASFVTGSVQWTDGQPVPQAWVFLRQAGDGALPAHDADTWTDEHGRFALPALPGRDADVEVHATGALVPTGEARRTVAGAHVAFVLPHAVTLRPVLDGDEDEQAQVELGEATSTAVYGRDAGRMLVVPTRSFRVRATDGPRRSAWRTIDPADAGKTIDLELLNPLAEVRIHVDADVPPVAACAHWRRSDGAEGTEYLSRFSGQPFVVNVEPGRYQVTVAANSNSDGDAAMDAFLLPFGFDVVAGSEPAIIRMRAAFGGRLEITATDSNGVAIAGRCIVRGASEAVAELDGDTRKSWSGVLAPGTYELHFHSAQHGTRHRTVMIAPRQFARITFRL